jgi:hypothetical protein
VQGLLVEAALARDHQVDTAHMRLEVDEFEDEAPTLQNNSAILRKPPSRQLIP